MKSKKVDPSERIPITKSCGDVFIDLGFSVEEAASLNLRCSLMDALEDILKKRRLTQAEAAKLLGVSQPRVSNLVRGRIDLFSIDALVEMLARAGIRVNVRLSNGRRRAAKISRQTSRPTARGASPAR